MNRQPLKVIISGGGTGGHIFPAVSIANALRQAHPDVEILFVGAEGRMEMEKVPAAGYSIVGLPVMGFDRKRLWRNFKVCYQLYKSIRKAKEILREFQPDIAVGVGGYASGPLLKQAQAFGIPTLIQEQNSYAGVTNKMLGAKAERICVAYDKMEQFFPAEKIVKTGNPVRQSVVHAGVSRQEAKRQLGFDSEKPLVAVVGGSLGARTINEAMKASVEKILASGASVLWQCGKFYSDECTRVGERVADTALQVQPFINLMDLVYRGADLIVSRAGASTISELQIVGAPAVLVPSPNVAEDHQRKNALALVERGAAEMILDADCVSRLGDTVIELLADENRRKQLSENVRLMALENADRAIVGEIEKVLKSKK